MIHAIQQWCAGRPEVTAAILTGSRARRGADVDDLSDFGGIHWGDESVASGQQV
ncbi:MAG: hypothetical protein HN463_17325 [Gemmatimonadales bacterium]|nr:hypothetical protein [Gemmatimonadales bacterium]MBT3958552.1 hypothetical protein [Gemmatimonadales bacterium]MBT6375514.1 hypothetical protein [Gemmatimonadales bacterium]MBT6696188.1 hypothetical protein [Gemmatimonadales bacterium]MBT7125005.1 hypothetical protein [Gemmatimonadales bacterium]